MSESHRKPSPPKRQSQTRSSEEPSPRKVKLPQEQIDKSVVRLYSSHRKERPLKDLVETKQLTQEQQDSSIKRLYSQSVEAQKNAVAALEKRLTANQTVGQPAPKVLEVHEISEAVARLYDQARQKKEYSTEKLAKKYVPPKEEHRLSADHQTEVNDRLFRKACSSAQSSRAALYDKFVTQHLPTGKKRSAEEWSTTVARLYQKPG